MNAFAFETRRHHVFASTGNAYDVTQCDEAIKAGGTLIILAEQVVAIASPKPLAVTETSGKLHDLSTPRPGESLAEVACALNVTAPDFLHAVYFARRPGFPIDPLLNMPAG